MNKKQFILIYPFLLGVISVLFLITACKKHFSLEGDVPLSEMTLPVVETVELQTITQEGAQAIAQIESNGGGRIMVSGFCWSEHENPDTSDYSTNDGSTDGKFRSFINDLKTYTTYYIRAYAANAKGISYGQQLTFKTTSPLAVLSTKEVNNITEATAVSGGIITEYAETVTERGVCWSANGVPTIKDMKTTDVSENADFQSNITGLSGGTTYAVRAYAVNSAGVAYGNTVYFLTTPPTFTDIDGNTYHAIKIGNQIWSMENLRTTRYRTGEPIYRMTTAEEPSGALESSGYGIYQNNESTVPEYGLYYNWYAVTDERNIAPVGWHVPTDAEWTELTTFLGGEGVAGGKLKEAGTEHWNSPNAGATNETGFTALGAGIFFFTIGGELGTRTIFWASSEIDGVGLARILTNTDAGAWRSGVPKFAALPVRLVKDK